ncbi:MAG TPA: SDR family oxidoreductase [Devosiaceae bacterium]
MTETALITGAADRLGAAMARRLASAGYRVVIHYRKSAGPAEALVQSIRESGGEAACIAADLSDRGDRKRLIADAGRFFGPLRVLVNNASTFEPDSPQTIDEDLWDHHFAVHVEAPAFLARDFAAQLPADATGNIVNIIDERVWKLTPSYFSYTVSKSALWTMTRTLAQGLAPRVRVNAIGPGPTLPHARQSQEDFERALQRLPLQRGATPDDIAEALVFLLRSPAITGQMLALDGGEHLEFRPESGVTHRK